MRDRPRYLQVSQHIFWPRALLLRKAKGELWWLLRTELRSWEQEKAIVCLYLRRLAEDNAGAVV